MLGGLLGWFSATLGCPPSSLLPHSCPSPGPHWALWWLLWDSFKATADLPPRQGKNRCFHQGHLRSLNFLPLEFLPALALQSTNFRVEPGRGAPWRSPAAVKATLFLEVTLCVPPPGPGPALLTSRRLSLLFRLVSVWSLICLPLALSDVRHHLSLTGPASQAR